MSRHVIKSFSGSTHEQRNQLGDQVTEYLEANPYLEVKEIRTHQSSDEAYHCLSIVVIGEES